MYNEQSSLNRGGVLATFHWLMLVNESLGSFDWLMLVNESLGSFDWQMLVNESLGLFDWLMLANESLSCDPWSRILECVLPATLTFVIALRAVSAPMLKSEPGTLLETVAGTMTMGIQNSSYFPRAANKSISPR